MARQRHLKITVEGKIYDVMVEEIDDDSTFYPAPDLASTARPPRPAQTAGPAPAAAAPAAPAAAVSTPSGVNEKLAPLGGVVIEITAREGDKVKAGDQVVVLESMKMKQVISAHRDGTVTKVHVQNGQAIDAGQPLISIE